MVRVGAAFCICDSLALSDLKLNPKGFCIRNGALLAPWRKPRGVLRCGSVGRAAAARRVDLGFAILPGCAEWKDREASVSSL